MTNKKQLKIYLKKLQSIKTWQLLILLILTSFVAATFLRLNNIGMIERREAVISADKAGDNSVTRDRLYDLQTYVAGHMNTDLSGGVFLESSFERAVERTYTASGGNIYQQAQEVCAPQFSSWSYAYVQCTLAELEKYPAATPTELPPENAYIYNFVSPRWSPDFAGFAVLICVVILIMIIARITTVVALKILLHRRYQAI